MQSHTFFNDDFFFKLFSLSFFLLISSAVAAADVDDVDANRHDQREKHSLHLHVDDFFVGRSFLTVTSVGLLRFSITETHLSSLCRRLQVHQNETEQMLHQLHQHCHSSCSSADQLCERAIDVKRAERSAPVSRTRSPVLAFCCTSVSISTPSGFTHSVSPAHSVKIKLKPLQNDVVTHAPVSML
jgi:hypothetical protein